MTASPRPAATAVIIWGTALLALLPWLVVQMRTSINGDMAWLLIAAQRMLTGAPMAELYYETNPPLSILLHVPPVVMQWFAGFPLHCLAYGYFLALAALSALAARAILRRWEFLDQGQKNAILLGFIVSLTIIPSISFAERDHVILMGLLPFVLVQLSLLWDIALPRRLGWPVLFFGALAILLKPHYGIVPTVFLLHRMIRKDGLNILKAPDFLFLAFTTAAYILAVTVFFSSYVTVILPDVLKLYIGDKNPLIAVPELIQFSILFAVFMGVEAAFGPLKDKSRALLLTLYGCALLCMIPYAIQLKGFYYQLIPALGFFMTALCLTAHTYVVEYVKGEKLRALVSTVLIFVMAYSFKPILLHYPTHQDYAKMPLTQALDYYCPDQPCTFFAFHNSVEILSQTVLYENATHASRFPSLWFLPPLYYGKNLTPEEQTALKEKFARYIAEDLERYKPSTLFLMSSLYFEEDRPFDFVAYFSDTPAFRAQIAHYKKTDTFGINRKDYLTGTDLAFDEVLEYDVYQRRD